MRCGLVVAAHTKQTLDPPLGSALRARVLAYRAQAGPEGGGDRAQRGYSYADLMRRIRCPYG